MMARRLFLFGFTVALLAGFGCSNGGGVATPPPAIACLDGGQAGDNVVVLNCGGATDNTTEQVDVVLGGPAAGPTTLRGLNFDVTYDPAKLEFVPAANYASPLFPDALILVTLSGGLQGRVVVAIQQPGGLPDVAVAPGQNEVLGLSFESLAGVTFDSTPLTFENAEATTASPAVGFADGLGLSYQ